MNKLNDNLFKDTPSWLAIFLLFPILFLLFVVASYTTDRASISTEARAIELVNQTYPELEQQNLERIYYSEEIGNIWYIAVGLLNADSSILSGFCFEVKPSDEITRRQMITRSPNISRIDPVTCEGE